MDVPNWIGFVAPAATPADIIQRLNRELIASMTAPDVTKTYDAQSMVKLTTSPDEFARKIGRELGTWGPIIKSLNVALD
jgi:tripartite-type tricarboxylate transporter receptor subunit TctC